MPIGKRPGRHFGLVARRPADLRQPDGSFGAYSLTNLFSATSMSTATTLAALIQQGLVVARYDSRDGYGAHPRGATYVCTDGATPPTVTAAPPPPPPAALTDGGIDPRLRHVQGGQSQRLGT